MKKGILTAILAGTMIMSMSMTAFAGWEQEGMNWRYNDNGIYVANGWQWIDGNGDGMAECYYFDSNGYMLANTVTPDGSIVDADGACEDKLASLSIKQVSGNQLSCELTIYRFVSLEFTGVIDPDGHAMLYEAERGIQGELVYDGEKMALILNDRPNFYAGQSLLECLGGLRFVFHVQ